MLCHDMYTACGQPVRYACVVGSLYGMHAWWAACTVCMRGGQPVRCACVVGSLYGVHAWWAACTVCMRGGQPVRYACVVGSLYGMQMYDKCSYIIT